MLFQIDFPRTDGAAADRESNFDYLQRSIRAEAIQICRWINEWFDEYPDTAKPQLEKRLKSSESKPFHGALFELKCHRMLKKIGLSVEVEPPLPSTERKIDFLAWPPGKKDQCFYMEATVSGFAEGPTTPSPSEQANIERIKRKIEGIPNLHSDVWLTTDGKLPRNLTNEHIRHITGKFEDLLNGCTADDVRLADITGNVPLTRPIQPDKESEWTIEGRLIPCIDPSGKRQVWGPSRSAIGGGPEYLSSSLEKKARKWKDHNFVGRPVIVVVNVCNLEFFWDTRNGDVKNIQIRDALFENPDRPEPSERFRRKLRSLNGVIVAEHIVLGFSRGRRARLFRNGDAEIPESLRFMLDEQKYEDLLGI